jgi:hypothetical protein
VPKPLIFVIAWQEAPHKPACLDTMHAAPCSQSGSKVDLLCAPPPNARSELQSSTTTHCRCRCIKRGPAQQVLYGRGRTCFQERSRAESSPASSHWDLCMPRSTLTEDQVRHVAQIAMRYLEQHMSINNKALRGLSGITYDQATYFFNRMLQEGRLLRTGRTAGTRYVRPENAQR